MKKIVSSICVIMLMMCVVLTSESVAKQHQRSHKGEVSSERYFSKNSRSPLTGKRMFNHEVRGFGADENSGIKTLFSSVNVDMRAAGPQKISASKASLYGVCAAFKGLEWKDQCFWGSIDVNEGVYNQIYTGAHYYTNDVYYEGGAVRDGVLYISTYTMDMFSETVNMYWVTVDIATGELLNPISFGNDFNAFCYTLTYDSDEDMFYGMALDQQYVPNKFVKIDPKTWTTTSIGTIPYNEKKGTFIAGVAYNPVDKKIYATRPAGDLVTINKENAQVITVGNLTKKSTPFSGYAQPMIYSPYDHGFITCLRDAETGVGMFYHIDAETADPSYLCSFENGAAFQILYCADPYAKDDAPAIPTIESINLDKGQLNASVTYTLPTETFLGDNITESQLNVRVYIDGTVVETTTAAPGETVTTLFTSTEGIHKIGVQVYSDTEKPSPIAEQRFYLGHDTPKMPTNVKLENCVVSWTAPSAEGVNGGYVDTEALRYNVYINGELRNATPIAETSLTVELEKDLASYIATVQAIANGKKSPIGYSDYVVYGDPMTVPFELAPSFMESVTFTSDDTNRDGNVWTYVPGFNNEGDEDPNKGQWMFFYNWASSADDWLFLPITTYSDTNAVYELTYDYENYYLYETEFDDMDVCIGTADTPEAMTTPILQIVNRMTLNPETHTAQFTIPQAGNYYIGFHIKTNPNGTGVRLSNFKVEKISDGNVPSTVDITVSPAERGELSALLNWTAPTTDILGNSLDASKDITYTIASTEETITYTVKPGAVATAKVKTFQGINEISVTPSNENGRGITTYYRLYTGIDIPNYATNVKAVTAEDNESMVLTWDAPTTGVNGGFIDPENIYYDIYYHYSIYYDKVGTTAETTFVYDPDPYLDQTVLTLRHIGPRAVNSAGESKNVYFIGETLGAPHELPMHETFAGAGIDYSPWNFVTAEDCANSQWDLYGSLSSLPFDNAELEDGGAVVVYGVGNQATRAELIIPKVTTKGHDYVSFKMKFYNQAYAPDMKLLGRHFGQDDAEVIAEIKHNDYPMNEWVTYNISLPAEYTNCGWVQLRLSCDLVAHDNAYGIFDGFSIYEEVDYDFRIGSITSEAESIAGNENQVMATLINSGESGASADVKFTVWADGEKLDEVYSKVGYLRSQQEKECYISLLAKPEYIDKEVIIRAEVVSADDMISSNNMKETEWKVSDTTEPIVTDLAGEWNDEHNQVTLTWSTPDLTYGDTDSFESYEEFYCGENIGMWKNIDEDGLPTFAIDGIDFPFSEEARGWQVMNAETMNTMKDMRLCPHTGKQYLMAMSIAYEEATQEPIQAADWLISPEVEGGSELSFWMGTISSQYSETIELWTSSTDDNVESFTKVRNFTKHGEESWEYVSCTLPEDAKYFAFKHVSWGAFGVLVDDIKFSPKEMMTWEVVKYNIYRDGKYIASTTSTNFVDETAGDESHVYNVTVVVNSNGNEVEGIFSNTANMWSSGIDEVELLQGVYGVNDAIIITGCEGKTVQIYTIDGKLIRDIAVGCNSVCVPSEEGIFVVNIGEKSAKIVVR